MIASVTGAKPTECHAEDENTFADTPSNLKSSKTTEATINRRPLGDHTNVCKNGRGEKLQSAIATIECSENVEETDSKEDIKIDDQGFVIWTDDKVEGERRADSYEVERLRSALASALEENRLLHAKISLMKSEHEELEELRRELEVLYELYYVAKQDDE